MKSIKFAFGVSLIAFAAGTGTAQADKLTLYCSAQEDWCQLMARSFEEATGIDVDTLYSNWKDSLTHVYLSRTETIRKNEVKGKIVENEGAAQ
mgnify:CR=1 FL=1